MGSLGTTLGAVEFFGTIVVFLLLAGGLIARRRRFTPVAVIAVLFGIVFANPFGVVARESTTDPRPLTPSSRADNALHWVKVAGVPVAWFRPYSEDDLLGDLYENTTGAELKLRYGLTFLPSTGASTVVGQCSVNIDDPCWKGRPDDYALVQEDRAGTTWVVPLHQGLLHSEGSDPNYVYVPEFFEVRLGLASPFGVVYWLVVLSALGAAAQRSRVRWSSVGIALACAAGVGIGIAAVFAVVPGPVRTAQAQPKVVPKPAGASGAQSIVTNKLIADKAYRSDCVLSEQEGNRHTTHYRCQGAAAITAIESRGARLALWTSQTTPDDVMWLRVQRLSNEGKPLGASRTPLPPWRGATTSNCLVPAALQAVALPGEKILVAWSDDCKTGAISAIVIDESGHLVRRPFVITRYDPGTSGQPQSFWLRTTVTGDAVLLRTGPASDYESLQSLYVSVLNDRLQAGRVIELTEGAERLGSVTLACGDTCAVFRAVDGPIAVMYLTSAGEVERETSIENVTLGARSNLAAVAAVDTFFVGWVESDGTNAVGRLATLEGTRPPSVAQVGQLIQSGERGYLSVPEAFGIAVKGGVPGLVWQSRTYVDGKLQFLVHTATPGGSKVKRVDDPLWKATLAGSDVLVAVAVTGLSDPVALAVP